MFPRLVGVVVILPLTTVLGDKIRPYTSTWCLWVSFFVNWGWQQNRAVIAPSIAGTVYKTSAFAFSDPSNLSFSRNLASKSRRFTRFNELPWHVAPDWAVSRIQKSSEWSPEWIFLMITIFAHKRPPKLSCTLLDCLHDPTFL